MISVRRTTKSRPPGATVIADKIPFLDLRAQHEPLRDEILAALAGVVDSCAYALGPAVESFERSFAEYLGVDQVIGVQSGTSALMAAFVALGIGRDDEVITAANTFVATAGAIHFVGARPVLVDMVPDTYNIDPEQIERAITPRTKAIVPVHLYGQCADMEPILEIASKHSIPVVEDASQAHGAAYKGRKAGGFGALACFSFYPGKNLGAMGEGGAVVTSDGELADGARRFRNHGGVRRYEHREPGLNARLPGFQGAVLDIKLKHLDRWNDRRREIASRYEQGLADTSLVLPREAPGCRHIYHLYVVQTDRREKLMASLGEAGIACGIHYPAPVHLLEAFAHLGYARGDFPAAERAAERIVSLPIFPAMHDEQVDRVIERLRAFDAS